VAFATGYSDNSRTRANNCTSHSRKAALQLAPDDASSKLGAVRRRYADSCASHSVKET
jgi:hypothetical protein